MSSSAEKRPARTPVLVNEQFDGNCFVHPVTAPKLAAYAREEDAIAELSLFLREHFARSPPAAKSRLSLPEEAKLIEIGVVLPRDDEKRRRDAVEAAVTFACVVVPARAREGQRERDDVWVLVPVLDHAFYVERDEPLEEAIRTEIRRLVGAQDLTAWEQLGLLPPRVHRLEVLEIPLADGPRASRRGRGASKRWRRCAAWPPTCRRS